MQLRYDTALVVLSGGQDSVTCLLHAKRTFPYVHAVTFDYGQRHARELRAAQRAAHLAGVMSHEIIRLPEHFFLGSSPLTDPTAPLEQYPTFEAMTETIGDRVELTFVPMRNAAFLTIAANRAAVLGAGTLITGVCEEDGTNYPDCRATFLTAMTLMVNQALGFDRSKSEGLKIVAPLLFLRKAAALIPVMTDRLGVAMLAFSHTAYDGAYPPTGRDHATVLRAESFKQAGHPDPLLLRAWLEGQPGISELMLQHDEELYGQMVSNESSRMFYENAIREGMQRLSEAGLYGPEDR